MTRDGSVLSNFLTPKIRKLAKNLVYFIAYIVGSAVGIVNYLVRE